ncbi:hypothetical protein BDK51DRAFT_47962, partial [Blyttiomyces helicus]
MDRLREKGYDAPLRAYLASNRPFMGICVGLQCLFTGSDESPNVAGLGLIPSRVEAFSSSSKAVPHMGWNAASVASSSSSPHARINHDGLSARYYF